MHEIKYRRATVDDVDSLVEFRVALLNEVSDVTGPEEALRPALPDYFRRTLPTGEYAAFVAEVDGRIVATCGILFQQYPPSFRNPKGRSGYVLNVYTLQEWRGRGLQAELLRRLIDLAKVTGVRKVSLHAEDLARPLYARAGFIPMDGEMYLEWLLPAAVGGD